MVCNFELHNRINDYVEQTTVEQLAEELDQMQANYNVSKRIHRDIMHLIELSDGLTKRDKLKLYQLLEDNLKERRYFKDVLSKVMLPHNFDKLMEHGTIIKDQYNFKQIDLDTSNRMYVLRSHLQDNSIGEYMDSVSNADRKFKVIHKPENEKEVFYASWKK